MPKRRQLLFLLAAVPVLTGLPTMRGRVAEHHYDIDPHSPLVHGELLRRASLQYAHVTASQPQDEGEELSRYIRRSRLCTRMQITCWTMKENGFSEGKIHRIKRAAMKEARRDFGTSRDPFKV